MTPVEWVAVATALGTALGGGLALAARIIRIAVGSLITSQDKTTAAIEKTTAAVTEMRMDITALRTHVDTLLIISAPAQGTTPPPRNLNDEDKTPSLRGLKRRDRS